MVGLLLQNLFKKIKIKHCDGDSDMMRSMPENSLKQLVGCDEVVCSVACETLKQMF